MAQYRRIRVDVYGRFEVEVIRRRGSWVAYRRGLDGKRSGLTEVAPWPEATDLETIVDDLEAALHEWGGPDSEVRVIDLQVG